MDRSRQLVPATAAQFPGSFASNLRQDRRRRAALNTWKSILSNYFTEGWNDISIWKSAFIEFIGMGCLTYISAMIHTVIGNMNTLQAAGYVGVTNVFMLGLFIIALASGSGGHVNPLITFTTMTTGLTGFSRGILYMIAQTAGGAVAGGLIRGSFGRNLTLLYQGGGCYYDSTIIKPGQAYLIESTLSFIIVFLSFGVGLDPRQAALFGPKLGPLLVGCILGIVSFASVGLAEGYPGLGANPARCFSYAVARGNFQYQWIWWIGPLSGALVNTAVYYIAPPYHRQLAEERAENIRNQEAQASQAKV